MALQDQNFEINLAQGLDTDTDKKYVIPGKTTTLENAVYLKDSTLSKRPGYGLLPNVTLDGEDLGSGSALTTFNDELLQYNNQNLYSYSPGSSAWIDKGPAVSAKITTRQIVKNTRTQRQADSAILNGVGVYAWEDSNSNVYASVYDETTGTPLLSDYLIAVTASRVRCLAFKQYLFVYYYDAPYLRVRRLNPLEPTSFDAAVNISINTTINPTNPTYDVLDYNGQRMVCVHNRNTIAGIVVSFIDETPSVMTGIYQPIAIAGETADNSIAVIQGPNQTFYLAYQNNTDGLRCIILNSGLTILHSAFTVEAITASDVENITGHRLTGSNIDTGLNLIYEVSASHDYDQYTKSCLINSDGTVGTPAVFLRSVGLASKTFKYTDSDDNENYYVGVTHASTLQSTYFLAKTTGIAADSENGMIVGKQQYTNGGGLTLRPILANVNVETDSTFSYVILRKNQIVSENSTIFTPTGVSKTTIDFASADTFNSRQLGNNLLIAGGILNAYDGQSVVEHGFHLYPENPAIASASSGSLADGTYGVVLLYEWTDNFGQIHRSEPSVATIITTSGGSKKITVTAPSLRLTRKDGTLRTNISIVGFVTELGGSTYYRYTSVSSPTYNDVTADTVALPDITTVSGISSNEILYTTGGVLPNMPAPACSVIEVFSNRIWLGGLEDQDSIWYSKENKKGEPVEFTDEFNKSVESARGPINSFGVLDDKILAIKKDKVYYSFGEGPNNTNTLGSFSELVATTLDIGTMNSKSVFKIPGGLILKSLKGFYSIDGNLASSYIGQDMEEYNNLTVTSSILLSEKNEMRFTTSDGYMMTYNYNRGKWSTAPRLKATAAVLWGNSYVILRTNGLIYQEDESVYRDNGNPYGIKLVTGWISLAGLTGFKRVRRLTFLGEYKSPHLLRISVAYDYSDAWIHSVTFDPDTGLSISRYGDDEVYGLANSVYGGNASAYLLRVDMIRQKCTSIRFKIEEIVVSSTEGTQQGLTISNMGLLVGLKPGSSRLRASQTTGVS